MLNYLLMQPVKIIYGAGSISQLGELLTSENKKKAMVVCDKGVIAAGIVDKATKSMQEAGIAYIIFDQVQPDAPSQLVEDGLKLYKEQGCDSIVAIGGGSGIDTGKGINLLLYNDGPALRFADFSTPMNPCPGLITIPTTSGTGSELSDGIVLSDENHAKYPILAPKAMSEFTILDPELAIGMPPHLTASTGIDAMSHAMESCTTNIANLLVDQIAEGLVKTVVEWLPVAVADGKNLEARSHMMICASLGGWMLGYGHTHASHSVAHVIGATFGIPHAFAVAYALPQVMAFNAPAVPERTKKMGEIMGAVFTGKENPEEIGALTRDAIIRFRDDKLGIQPATNFKVDPSKFDAVAEDIVNELFQVFNPRKMEKEDAKKILERIFKG